jgi:hypothetical protein
VAKLIRLISEHSDEYVAALEGCYLDERHYHRVVAGEDADVVRPSHRPLAFLRREVIPAEVCWNAFDDFRRAARQTNHRTVAAGGAERFHSGILGWFEGRFVGSITEAVARLLRQMDLGFARIAPAQYADLAQPSARSRRIESTAFSTVTVNKNARMAVHRDDGNAFGTFGAMTVVWAEPVGGLFVLPKYRVAVGLRTGDLLIVDNQEFHGNTAIGGPSTRVSVVSYLHSRR